MPVDAEALEPHLADELDVLTFGPGGDVHALDTTISGRSANVRVGTPSGEQRFVLPFAESYNVTNALAAIAIGVSLDADLEAMARRAADITFSRLRGEHHALRGGITLVNDCYNANPISMHAALESLAEMPGTGRKVAILGGMAELGPDAATYHREIGSLARGLGIAPCDRRRRAWRATTRPTSGRPTRLRRWRSPTTSSPTATSLLVKGSRSVGLEHFSDELIGRRGDG